MMRKISTIILAAACVICVHMAYSSPQDGDIPSLKAGKVYKLSDLKQTELQPGSKSTLFWGKNMLINIIEFKADPDYETPPFHAHPHEQFAFCLDGEFTMTVGEDTFIMREGDVCYMPPNVMHGGTPSPVKGAKLMDVFSPVRESFIEKAKEQGTDKQ